VLLGISAFISSAACAFSAPLAHDPIRLGMVAPLSGDFAPNGQHIKRGIDLAMADLDRQGVATKLFMQDACLPAQERAAISKLVTTDRIQALVGSYCVIGMVASLSIIESARVISFQNSGATREILDGGDYIFTSAPRTSDEAEALAEFAYRQLQLRSAAILYLTTQWGEEYSGAFRRRFHELGGRITASATNPIGVTDLRGEITKLRDGDPDGLLIVHLTSTLGSAIRQARQLGFKKQILTTGDSEEASVIESAGASAEGLRFLSSEPLDETREMRSFSKTFKQRFEDLPHMLSRYAYEATMLAVDALQKCNLSPECAKRRLYEITNYSGASGVFSIDPDGGARREFAPKVVKNGNFTRELAPMGGLP